MTDEKTHKYRLARTLLILSLLVPLGACDNLRQHVTIGILAIAFMPYAIGDALIPDDPMSPPAVSTHISDLEEAYCGIGDRRRAWQEVARNFEEGHGTEKDPKEAYFWHSLASKEAGPRGYHGRIAAEYRSEAGDRLTPEERAEIDAKVRDWVPRDCPRYHHYAKGPDIHRQWYLTDLEAASCGWKGSLKRLAEDYREGKGTGQDLKEAHYWYSLAARQGYDLRKDAKDVAAQLTPEERAEVDKRVEAWVPRDCPTDIDEQRTLRGEIWERTRYRLDLEWASCGNKAAQFDVGRHYQEGYGTEEDRNEAYFWYSLLVSQGYKSVAYYRDQVSDRLTSEERAETDARVEAWAPRGCPKVSQPNNQLVQHRRDLYRASCGQKEAQNKVAANYRNGRGTEEDPKEAYFWYSLIAKRWDRDAAENRRIVGSQLTSQERAAIDTRVEAWVPRDCPLVGGTAHS